MAASTRQGIISALQHTPMASATHLGQQLHRSRPDILHHLRALIHTGVVESIKPDQRSSGRGRPVIYFRLTSIGFTTEMSGLLYALLNVLSTYPDPQVLLQQVAFQITGQIDHKQVSSPIVVNHAIEWLNTHGYIASWEASPHGPRIRLVQCPYRSLADTNPILCQLDACILQNLVGDSMVITQVKSTGSSRSSCIFEQTATH